MVQNEMEERPQLSPRQWGSINVSLMAASSSNLPTRRFEQPLKRYFRRSVKPAIDAARTKMGLKSFENLFRTLVQNPAKLDSITIGGKTFLRTRDACAAGA
jgi:hypothetical protein